MLDKSSQPNRSLRPRGPAKRSRDSLPSDPPETPPAPAVVSQDGTSPRRAQQRLVPPPRLPGFLAQSQQDMDGKFLELTWVERNRLAEGSRKGAAEDSAWALYKQPDTHEKMDRYLNIKPWARNRVKLRVPPNELDYVNASAITLSSPTDATKPPLCYIAMQGPTVPSFDYVWRMVAEQLSSPAVIVQLTNMVELNVAKCDQYFPPDDVYAILDVNEDNNWGDDWKARLTFDSMEKLAGGAIEKRKLLLHVGGEKEPRVVWHFFYRRWPDFGVPTARDLDSFFELMKLSRDHGEPSSARIVHCSAGIGRTGTFICLEHLMRELESGALERYDSPGEQPDLVYNAIEALRQQRRGMVQGEIQFRFIYQVMSQLWKNKYHMKDEHAGSDEPAAKRLEVADPFTDAGAPTRGHSR